MDLISSTYPPSCRCHRPFSFWNSEVLSDVIGFAARKISAGLNSHHQNPTEIATAVAKKPTAKRRFSRLAVGDGIGCLALRFFLDRLLMRYSVVRRATQYLTFETSVPDSSTDHSRRVRPLA